MAARVVSAAGQSSFRTLDFILVVFRVFAVLNSMAGLLSLGLMVMFGLGPPEMAEIAPSFGWLFLVCVGSALFCIVSEQVLVLGRRAVIALETLASAPRALRPNPSLGPNAAGLPPPP